VEAVECHMTVLSLEQLTMKECLLQIAIPVTGLLCEGHTRLKEILKSMSSKTKIIYPNLLKSFSIEYSCTRPLTKPTKIL
jgi:hypothetical protein